jgi:hypothetical protein
MLSFKFEIWERMPNTGSGRTPTVPEPKTKDFMLLLVQLTKGTA